MPKKSLHSIWIHTMSGDMLKGENEAPDSLWYAAHLPSVPINDAPQSPIVSGRIFNLMYGKTLLLQIPNNSIPPIVAFCSTT